MRITLRELRRIIREQVGAMVYLYNAGYGSGEGGISSPKSRREKLPPGLGDEGEEEQEEHGKEQEKSQWAVRARRGV
jgi:hypothetical protein